MSVLGLIDQDKMATPSGGIEAPSTTFGDVVSASFSGVARNFSVTSKGLFEYLEQTDRDKTYFQLTGRNIYDDAFTAAPNGDELRMQKRMASVGSGPKIQKAVDDFLAKMRTENPEQYGKVMNSGEIAETVKTKAREALKGQAKAAAGATPVSAFSGQIVGGIGAGFVDPLNLATIPLGAGMAAGIFKTALIEAGINAGAEVVSYPFVKKWQDELGQEYGAPELMENVGLAALFGGVIGGGTKALSKGLEAISNSAKLSEIRARFDEVDAPEPVQALRHEERRLHIQESDVTRYNEGLDPALHQKALPEVDAAINEGRPLDMSKIPLTDDEVRAMLPNEMDPALAKIHSRMVEPIEVDPSPTVKGEMNELVDLSQTKPLPLERQIEVQEMIDSPEFKAKERAEFEAAFGEEAADPQARVFGDDDSGAGDMTIESLRKSFDDDDQYLSAISSCGLGGKS